MFTMGWVLRLVYHKPRLQTLKALDQLPELDVLQIEEPDAVRQAVQAAGKAGGDFTDRLIGHLNRAKGCRFTVTFDRPLAGLAGAAEFSVL